MLQCKILPCNVRDFSLPGALMPAEINATISAHPPVRCWASKRALGTVPRLAVAVLVSPALLLAALFWAERSDGAEERALCRQLCYSVSFALRQWCLLSSQQLPGFNF